jgi:hypothetical protein
MWGLNCHFSHVWAIEPCQWEKVGIWVESGARNPESTKRPCIAMRYTAFYDTRAAEGLLLLEAAVEPLFHTLGKLASLLLLAARRPAS